MAFEIGRVLVNAAFRQLRALVVPSFAKGGENLSMTRDRFVVRTRARVAALWGQEWQFNSQCAKSGINEFKGLQT